MTYKKVTLEVENLKCSGCKTTLHNSIVMLEGIISVVVNSETSEITVEYKGEKQLIENQIKRKLEQIGYPQKGTGNSFQKAKSYVSCAKGKLSEKTDS